MIRRESQAWRGLGRLQRLLQIHPRLRGHNLIGAHQQFQLLLYMQPQDYRH
jgi:hypothetical protein